MSFQASGRIAANLVSQVRVDKPGGNGVVLRPWAKSSTSIPREAERKPFEQEARLNNVYTDKISASGASITPRLNMNLKHTSVVILVPSSDLIPHAPNSAGWSL